MSINSKLDRRSSSFEIVDNMPPEVRECVHEYGLAVVQACLQANVRRPNAIHQLVREIWEGARQPAQRRKKTGTLDWILLQAGAEINAAALIRILRNNDLVIAPICPTTKMIDASMAEVSGFNQRVTKTEKHRRRLMAALRAAGDSALDASKSDAAVQMQRSVA